MRFYLPESRYRRREVTDYIVIHCAYTRPEWSGGVQEIRHWHLDRGWIDVGYHFIIRRDGTLENGRPMWAWGAHVRSHNDNSVGICMVGGMSIDGQPEENFTDEQWKALKLLTGVLKDCFYHDARVAGHRDFPGVTKACPCFDVAEWYNEVFV